MNKQTWNDRWPLERVLFLMAGTFVMLGSILAALVSEWFLLLPAFVALNMLLFSLVGFCGASLILGRGFGVKTSCQLERSQAEASK